MNHPSHIIAIGASAGGLEALRQLFSVKLQGTKLAFVIIQHISPNHKSLMPELLSKVADIPVVTIQQNQEIEAGQIYLIPRGFRVRMDGWTFVTEPTDPLRRVLNLPINIFFRSAADVHKEKVIGVVLSGTGSDGALGLQRIHEVGGLTVVQAPESAQFDGMPRAALDTVRADFILNPAEMIPEMIRYCQDQGPLHTHPEAEAGTSDDDETLTQIFRILASRVGIDYSKYKTPTLARRIEKRMKLNRVQNLVEYADLLTVNPEECQELAKDFLINVTQFFRDPESFSELYKKVVLPLVRDASPGESLRIWVPACATGEEAYTIAILLLEAQDELKCRVPFKVFATDLDADSVQVASRGIYPASLVSIVPEEIREKYFIKRENTYAIDASVRERILFAPQDLIHSPPFRRLNLISCRNVLIYFQHPLQMEILRKFHFSLVTGGYLFLGGSESISDAREDFEAINTKCKIFRKLGSSTASRPHWTRDLMPESSRVNASQNGQAVALPLGNNTTVTRVSQIFPSLFEAALGPGVIVNESKRIVHFVGDVSLFFAHPIGEASFEALKLVRAPYRAALHTALVRLFGENRIDFDRIVLEVREPENDVSTIIKATRFRDTGTGEYLAFVGFGGEEADKSALEVIEVSPDSHALIRELEHELEKTRDRLQSSIEALEITNEELHSTNEELLSANEELQSTNEELQSVNEELHTVNSEHQMKIEELIELNSDLDNLLAHTDIGVLFLDDQLNVRKYTQAAKKYAHVMERDVGRSIRHLAVRINFPNFIAELEHSLKTGETTEHKVYQSASTVVLVRLVPYRITGGNITGVTVLFINVNYQNDLMDRLGLSYIASLRNIISRLPLPAFMLTHNGHYLAFNEAMTNLAQIDLCGALDQAWLDEDLASLNAEQNRRAIVAGEPVEELIELISRGQEESFRRIIVPLPQAPQNATQSPLVGLLIREEEGVQGRAAPREQKPRAEDLSPLA